MQAKAGIQYFKLGKPGWYWIPAFAGMTVFDIYT